MGGFQPQHPHLHEPSAAFHRHFPAPYLGAITHHPSAVKSALYKPTSLQQPSPLQRARRQLIICGAREPSSVPSQQRHHGKVQLMFLFFKHFLNPWRGHSSSCLHRSTGRPAVGVTHRPVPLQGGKIWDDLPNQQETLPPLCLFCHRLIRAHSLPVSLL